MLEQSAFLRAAVDIGHLGARVDDEGALLEAVADLFLRAFDLAAVQVYLVDGSGLFGDLRHHVGVGDRKAISRTPGVPVGTTSGLSKALAGGGARRIEDMRSLPRNAVPAEAKSGMALPLNVEGRVLGALLLYGAVESAFAAADMTPFVALTDMLALALENVRARGKGHVEWAASGGAGAPGIVTLSRPQPGGVAVSASSGSEAESGEGDGHTAPITLQGAVVGSLSFRGAGRRELEPDEIDLIDSVADQVAQAIENLNLLEEAQHVAQREQLINAITAQLQRATSVDEVLKTAAQAIRTALGDVEVTARLSPEAIEPLLQEPPGDDGEAK